MIPSNVLLQFFNSSFTWLHTLLPFKDLHHKASPEPNQVGKSPSRGNSFLFMFHYTFSKVTFISHALLIYDGLSSFIEHPRIIPPSICLFERHNFPISPHYFSLNPTSIAKPLCISLESVSTFIFCNCDTFIP